MHEQPTLDTLEGVLIYRDRIREIEESQSSVPLAERPPIAVLPQTLGRILDTLLALIPEKHRIPSRPVLHAQSQRPVQVGQNRTERALGPTPPTSGPLEPPTPTTSLSPRRKRKRKR